MSTTKFAPAGVTCSFCFAFGSSSSCLLRPHFFVVDSGTRLLGPEVAFSRVVTAAAAAAVGLSWLFS